MMTTIGSSYRSIPSATRSRTLKPQAASSGDRVTLSGVAAEKPRDLKKMALFGAIGTAVGVAAAGLLSGGVGGVILAGLIGGVGGAAIADGALTDAGTKEPKPFDPYNPSDVLDPDNLYHPRNPFNPMNFSR